MKQFLFVSFLLITSIGLSQNQEDLKSFINKNDVALHAVQKTIIAKSIFNYTSSFSNLLKKQVAAVKLFSSNQEQAEVLATEVRTACVQFLKQYAEGSTAFYEFTPKKNLPLSTIDISSILSADESKITENISITDFQALNSLILTIK